MILDVQVIRNRLKAMIKSPELPPEHKTALDRAHSWLGNITNPLPETERERWRQEILPEIIDAEMDTTDADMRNDLREHHERSRGGD